MPLLAARFLARFEREERRQTGGLCPGDARRSSRATRGRATSASWSTRCTGSCSPSPTISASGPITSRRPIRETAQRPSHAAPLATLLARIELALIRQRLDALPTKTAAARSLGITREALYGKLRRLGAPTRGR